MRGQLEQARDSAPDDVNVEAKLVSGQAAEALAEAAKAPGSIPLLGSRSYGPLHRTASDLGVLRAAIQACAAACRACGEECERHAEHHEHCRACSRSCRRCEQACTDLLAAIG